ncbi:tyrosine-type recombinase/integrase [Plantactinospora solaniradicis]|uniref:Tyrosine-type recombinase/integrase n=1 Tax=Plantactinospora solaniradicis TaxID=1723736 RepID=A0ABW1K5H3_9ACTN
MTVLYRKELEWCKIAAPVHASRWTAADSSGRPSPEPTWCCCARTPTAASGCRSPSPGVRNPGRLRQRRRPARARCALHASALAAAPPVRRHWVRPLGHTHRQRPLARLRNLAGAAGIPSAARLSLHSLRHAFATGPRESGIPLEDVQDAMGHVDSRTTRRCDHDRHNLDRDPAHELATRQADAVTLVETGEGRCGVVAISLAGWCSAGRPGPRISGSSSTTVTWYSQIEQLLVRLAGRPISQWRIDQGG